MEGTAAGETGAVGGLSPRRNGSIVMPAPTPTRWVFSWVLYFVSLSLSCELAPAWLLLR